MFAVQAKLWAPWLPPSALVTVGKTGWYAADVVPGKLRVIALNTNYWAPFNQFTDVGNNDHLAHTQFAWLESELGRAKADGVKVYINGPSINQTVYKSTWRNILLRDVVCYRIPAPLVQGHNGPNQHTSRIRYKEVSTPFTL